MLLTFENLKKLVMKKAQEQHPDKQLGWEEEYDDYQSLIETNTDKPFAPFLGSIYIENDETIILKFHKVTVP